MTPEEIQQIKLILVDMHEYYSREVKPSVIQMMAADLEDLDFEMVKKAFVAYRRDPKNRGMPLPAHIRALVEPQGADPRSIAIEVTNLILTAIKKFQYDLGTPTIRSINGMLSMKYGAFDTPDERLRDAVGELGERVCRRMGWRMLVDSYFEGSVETLRAQIRDCIVATMDLSRNGQLNTNFLLPMPLTETLELPKHHEVTHKYIANMIQRDPNLIEETGAKSISDLLEKLSIKKEMI